MIIQQRQRDTALWSVTNTYDDMRREKMKSILMGMVHDSIENDVYPGELFDLALLYKYNCEERTKELKWLTCPLEISFEAGSSWGGCLELSPEELSSSEMVVTGKGLRKDFLQFVDVASRAYRIEHEVKERIPTKPSDFGSEVMIRDHETWKFRMQIRKQA